MGNGLGAPSIARAAAVLALLTAVSLAAPAGAQAHAFLVRSTPQAGARLASSPRAITLAFSEPFVAGSARVSVRDAESRSLALPPPAAHGAVARQPLPARLHGVLIVTWRVLADDGHLTTGEFAFAVGRTGSLPAASSVTTARTPSQQVVFSLLFFVGLALALGGIASERLIWNAGAETARRAPVGAGLMIATAGAAGQLIQVAGERGGGGFSAGLSGSALASAIGTRPGLLTLVVIAALLLAAASVRLGAPRWLAAIALVGAVAATSLRSHAWSSGHAWAVTADVIHLAGAAIWVGALAHLVVVTAASERARRGVVFGFGVRRYAAAALPLVLVILLTGVLSAVVELGSIGELATTGYGRTLLVKGALVAFALGLALLSRLRALPADADVRLGLLRPATRAEAGMLVAVLAAVAILVNSGPPRDQTARAAAPALLGPAPVSGPTLQLGDLAGLATVVGLEAGGEELRFRVLKSDDPAPAGTRMIGEAVGPGRAVDLYPRSCGRGCFRIRYRLQPGLTRLAVKVTMPGWPGGTAQFRIPWPPRAAPPALLARVRRAMRNVPTFILREHVTSGPGASAASTSRDRGKAFMASEPYAAGAVDVRALDARRPHRAFAFALPGSDIWVRIRIDARLRLRREAIVSPGHLIKRSFAYPRRVPRRARR